MIVIRMTPSSDEDHGREGYLPNDTVPEVVNLVFPILVAANVIVLCRCLPNWLKL
jgi:hypothetical protein